MPTYTSPASAEGVAALALTAPTLTGEADGETDIDWSWSAVTGATSYEFEAGAAPGGPYTADSATTTPPTVTHTTTGLDADTTLYGRVRAVLASPPATGPWSAEASATTDAGDLGHLALDAPTVLAFSGVIVGIVPTGSDTATLAFT